MTGRDEEGWHRLHPLSPVIRFGRALFVILFALAVGTAQGGQAPPPYLEIGIGATGVVGGFVAWLVTRWRVAGPELHIETGLVRRQSLRVPAGRIQSVDIVRPALARVAGLSEVRVDVAGHGRNKTRLAYLTDRQATALRARLLALAHGVAEDAPTPPGRRIFSVDNRRLLASVLLGVPAVTFLVIIVLLAVVTGTEPRNGPAVGGVLFSAAISFVSVTVRRFAASFEFCADEAPDGLRISAGLLQTRSETVPFARIQGVRVRRPLIWRPLGWVRLEIDVARQSGDRRGGNKRTLSRALLPVGGAADATAMLSRVVPQAETTVPAGARRPARAVIAAPMSYHNLAAWSDARYAYASTGRLQHTLTIVPLAKAQSIRLVQGPLLRALRLATLHVDVAGRGWHAVARCRDAAEAERDFDELARLAHTARAQVAY